MKTLLLVLLTVPLLLNAQTQNRMLELFWQTGLSWEQIKVKAKQDNKFIFIDCYATWCGLCKAMDREVYPNDSVVKAISDDFIAVKVQMDSTAHDDSLVRKWYHDGADIRSAYHVNAYPTFLFFSPEGKPLHKAVGYKNPSEFTALLHDAVNPQRQYYTALYTFQPGKWDTTDLKSLARAYMFSEDELAWKMSADYLSRISSNSLSRPDNLQFMMEFRESPQVQIIATNYLKTLSIKEFCNSANLQLVESFRQFPEIRNLALEHIRKLDIKELQEKPNQNLLRVFKDQEFAIGKANEYIRSLSERELYTESNILFLTDFTTHSSDIAFSIFLHHEHEIDSVMRNHNRANIYYPQKYTEALIDAIIQKEALGAYWASIKKTSMPRQIPWGEIFKIIKRKYNEEYADRNILKAKVALYRYYAAKFDKNWNEYIRYNIDLIDKYGTDTTSAFIDETVINSFCWEAIFLHSTNEKEITTAIKWMKGVVRRGPAEDNRIDTYANLLYKGNRRKEAISWENKALEIAMQKKDESSSKTYQSTIQKMTKGEPTWVN